MITSFIWANRIRNGLPLKTTLIVRISCRTPPNRDIPFAGSYEIEVRDESSAQRKPGARQRNGDQSGQVTDAFCRRPPCAALDSRAMCVGTGLFCDIGP